MKGRNNRIKVRDYEGWNPAHPGSRTSEPCRTKP